MSEKRSRAQRQAAGIPELSPTASGGVAAASDEFQRGAGGSRRYPPPAEMKGATAFSEAGEVRSAAWLFDTIRSTPLLGEEFLAAMRVNSRRGPKRKQVDWVLLYLDFVSSSSVDVQPWYDEAADALFRAAGCENRPCYKQVFNRFIELEGLAAELERAAARLIQQARRFEPRIGMYVHVDSTEAETHAALVHACSPDDPDCKVWQARREHALNRAKREANWGRLAQGEIGDPEEEPGEDELEIVKSENRPGRMDTKEARELRHKETENPVEEADEDESSESDGRPRVKDVGVDEVRIEAGYKLVKVGGCWYRTRDTTAGIRAYTRPGRGTTKFWHGFYNVKETCHLMKAPIAVEVACSSEQEFDIYPRLMERGARNLGSYPRAVVADRGFSVKKVFHWNTLRGIASVMHWRMDSNRTPRTDHERYDRHGIPRCVHCGGPTEFIRFANTPTPRIWFRCMHHPTEACKGEQTISCSADWKALVPLRRDDPVYLELRRSHQSFEAVHDYWRDRYKVGAADIAQRPKRIGIEWQQLRANGALLIEWLRICYLHGWLGDHGRPCSASTAMKRGIPAAESLRHFRTQIGLDGHYGEAAVRAFDRRSYRRSPSERWQLHSRWTKRCDARKPRRRASDATAANA